MMNIQPAGIDAVAAAWITEHKNYREQKEKKIGWAYRELNRICEEDPGTSLKIIERICEKNSSDEIMELLAAGPLENLLVMHGVQIVPDVVELAKRNAIFRDLLGGVWKSTIDDKVWEQIENIRSMPW